MYAHYANASSAYDGVCRIFFLCVCFKMRNIFWRFLYRQKNNPHDAGYVDLKVVIRVFVSVETDLLVLCLGYEAFPFLQGILTKLHRLCYRIALLAHI